MITELGISLIIIGVAVCVHVGRVILESRRGHRPKTETPNRKPPRGGSGTAKPQKTEAKHRERNGVPGA